MGTDESSKVVEAGGSGHRLALGTAQWGMPYGVMNETGQPGERDLSAMLAKAWASGIRRIDTAPEYGIAEEVIGRCLSKDSQFGIFSKIRVGPFEKLGELVLGSTRSSVKKLGVQRLDGLLAHRPSELLGEHGKDLWGAMEAAREVGLVRKLGVSIYTADQLDALLDRFPIEILQAPVSIIDQRLLRGDHLQRAKDRRIEIHARSVFLQGVLLKPAESLPQALGAYRSHLATYHERRESLGLTPLAAALSFALSRREIDYVVCGAEHPDQLDEILAVTASPDPVPEELLNFASDDPGLVNPATWTAA